MNLLSFSFWPGRVSFVNSEAMYSQHLHTVYLKTENFATKINAKFMRKKKKKKKKKKRKKNYTSNVNKRDNLGPKKTHKKKEKQTYQRGQNQFPYIAGTFYWRLATRPSKVGAKSRSQARLNRACSASLCGDCHNVTHLFMLTLLLAGTGHKFRNENLIPSGH